jgi:DNA-binding NarL/FixJ family response regulator
MGIHLARVSGVEAMRQINKKVPQCRVIGMSSLYTPHSYNAMMAAGAVAFVHKADTAEALYKTLAFVINIYGSSKSLATAKCRVEPATR